MAQVPFLGTARAVQRRSLHALLRGTSVSNTTTLDSTRLVPPTVAEHLDPIHTIYDHRAHHIDPVASIYDHQVHHHTPSTKPISKWGYRVSPFPLLSTNRTQLTAPVFVNNFIKRYSTVAGGNGEKKRVAVVLSGCGVLDGSEIHEAVSVLVHLSRAGVETRMFAPDVEQSDVINHVKGSGTGDAPRNVLIEAARIARGKIKPLSQLQAESFSAVIFPGGYGAAKNLCNFAKQGENLTVQSDVQRVIKEFHEAKKPIGMLCVSPVIVAKLIPGVTVTLGNEDKDIEGVIQKLGAKHTPLGVSEVAIDNENNVISSPAYMTNSPIHKVFDGIGKFVETVLSRAPGAVEQKADAKS